MLPSLQVNSVSLSAADPQFVDKARTVGKGQTLIVTNYVLQGDTQPSTLNLKRVELWRPNAQVVVQSPNGAVVHGPPDTRAFRGTVVGSPGSNAVLTIRDNGGVTGLALRGQSSWALGKQAGSGAAATAPLGSRKSRPGESVGIPKFPEDDMAISKNTPTRKAGTAQVASGLLQVLSFAVLCICNASSVSMSLLHPTPFAINLIPCRQFLISHTKPL